MKSKLCLRFDCAGQEQQRINIDGARGLQSVFLGVFGHFALGRALYGGPQGKKFQKKSAPLNACASAKL